MSCPQRPFQEVPWYLIHCAIWSSMTFLKDSRDDVSTPPNNSVHTRSSFVVWERHKVGSDTVEQIVERF